MLLTFPVAAPPERVFHYLSDPELFAQVHPLIVSMRPTGPESYRVLERVARGPIPLHFTYPAWVKSDPVTRTVNTRVRIWGVIHATMEFRVLPTAEGSQVEERVEFRSFLPVRRTLEGVFREEHARLFQNIEAAIRGAARAWPPQ